MRSFDNHGLDGRARESARGSCRPGCAAASRIQRYYGGLQQIFLNVERRGGKHVGEAPPSAAKASVHSISEICTPTQPYGIQYPIVHLTKPLPNLTS